MSAVLSRGFMAAFWDVKPEGSCVDDPLVGKETWVTPRPVASGGRIRDEMFVPDTCETLVLASPLLSVDSSSGFPE